MQQLLVRYLCIPQLVRNVCGVNIFKLLSIATLLHTFFSPVVIVANEIEDWQPKATQYDWVQLTSDEWLKGKIHAMYDDELEFDSEKLNLLNIDWDDVKSLQSHQYIHILFAAPNTKNTQKTANKHGGIFTGKMMNKLTGKARERVGENADAQTGLLKISGNLVTITNGNHITTFNRDDIVSFAPIGQREIDLWTMKIGISLNAQRGNVRELDYSAKTSAKRRTATTRFSIDYLGNISQTNTVSGSTVKTANNHRVSSVLDVYINRYFLYTPFNLEYYRDPFRNLDQRITVGVGLGYILRDTKKLRWEVSTGPSFLRTTYQSIQPGQNSVESSLALMLGTKVDAELTNKLDFIFNYDIKASKKKSGGYSHHMLATFEYEITKRFDLDFSFMWDRINHPAIDNQGVLPNPDDYRIMMGIDFTFD